MQNKRNWLVERARPEDAAEILNLIHDGMRFYAAQSGLGLELAEKELSALKEDFATVQTEIIESTVLVVRNEGKLVASLRLKALPNHLNEEIIKAGLRAASETFLTLETAPDAAVTCLPSYFPETYYLLTRFAVARDFRASGIGAALVREAFTLAKQERKNGIFLYTAVENAALLNFYRSFGFQVQSVSSSRGYPRALLFAPCVTSEQFDKKEN